jgi:nucleotide-binding universal stress UspA family protein
MPEIIVGMDESDGAAHALRWAVNEAAGRDWHIEAVHAWECLDRHQLEVTHTFDLDDNVAVARKVLAGSVERALGDGAAHIDQDIVCDQPGPALVARSIGANLLVVGARGLGGFKSLLLGSVSNHCIHHSHCPVVVVRPGIDPVRHVTERIVVGIDGSPTAQRALRWALDMARQSHATVEIVHAWQAAIVGGPFTPVTVDPKASADAAERALDQALALEDTKGVHVARNLSCGGAALAIIDAAAGADLVVVGSRGRGPLGRMLLGSVGNQVAHHAPCPVAVVPPEAPRDR